MGMGMMKISGTLLEPFFLKGKKNREEEKNEREEKVYSLLWCDKIFHSP